MNRRIIFILIFLLGVFPVCSLSKAGEETTGEAKEDISNTVQGVLNEERKNLEMLQMQLQAIDESSELSESLNKELRNLEMLQMQLQILRDQELEEKEDNGAGTKAAEKKSGAPEERKEVFIQPNENIMLKKELDEYDMPVYSINAKQVQVSEILKALSAVYGKSIIVDEEIAPEYLSSFINVSIKKSPLQDILEVIIGMRNLEFIPKENAIFVTSLSQLNVDTASDYYKDKAAQIYQRAQIKYPNDKMVVKAYYELGNYYYDLGFNFLALQEYQVVVKKYITSLFAKDALFKIGDCYYRLNDPESAIRAYFQFIYGYPKDPLIADAFMGIGDSLMMQGFYVRAKDTYERVLNGYPETEIAAKAQLNIAKALAKMEKHREAIRALMEARELYNSLHIGAEIEYLIGKCLFSLKEYEDAKTVLGNFLANAGNERYAEDASFLLGECFYNNENYVEAFQVFKRALETYPNSSNVPRGMYFLGKSLRAMHFYDSAIKTFREGIQFWPTNEYADKMAMEIGWCYFDDDNYARAQEGFKDFIKKYLYSKVLIEGMVGLADALFCEKKYEQAVKAYIDVLGNSSEKEIRAFAFERIGACYKAMGKLEQAIKAFRLELG